MDDLYKGRDVWCTTACRPRPWRGMVVEADDNVILVRDLDEDGALHQLTRYEVFVERDRAQDRSDRLIVARASNEVSSGKIDRWLKRETDDAKAEG